MEKEIKKQLQLLASQTMYLAGRYESEKEKNLNIAECLRQISKHIYKIAETCTATKN